MIISNPTGNEITVQIKGQVYTLPANGKLKDVPAEAAAYWKNNLHNFIKFEDEVEKAETPKTEKKEVVQPASEPVVPPASETKEETKTEVKATNAKK